MSDDLPPDRRITSLLQRLDDLLSEAARQRQQMADDVRSRTEQPFWPDRRRAHTPHEPDRRVR